MMASNRNDRGVGSEPTHCLPAIQMAIRLAMILASGALSQRLARIRKAFLFSLKVGDQDSGPLITPGRYNRSRSMRFLLCTMGPVPVVKK